MARHALIVNADDFGLTAAINAGVARAHAEGIVTSTTVLVRATAAGAARATAAAHPALGFGLHVMTEPWTYPGTPWTGTADGVPPGDAAAAAAELDAQLARFERILGRPPTHLDGHHHVHRDEPLRSAVLERAARLGVPVREVASPARFADDFYGDPDPDAVSADALVRLLDTFDGSEAIELMCHPSAGPTPGSRYSAPRTAELETLCSPQAHAAVADAGLRLASYEEFATGGTVPPVSVS